jgi:hypothetical protein
MRLMNLYQPFAETLEGDAFDDLRTRYAARYEQAVYRMQEHLEAIAPLVPKAWYERLKARIILEPAAVV